MEYELYNAGLPLEDQIKFSLSSDKTDHATGSWKYVHPKQSWITVSTELALTNDTTLRVEFPTDVIRKYGERGVVMVISESEKKKKFGDGQIPEHQPFATSKEAGVERANDLWNGYTLKIAQNHCDQAMQARATGGLLRKATGFTAYCLKMHNVVDPGDEMLRLATGGTNAGVEKRVDELEKELKKSSSRLERLLTNPKVLAALGADEEPEPVRSGPPSKGGKNAASV